MLHLASILSFLVTLGVPLQARAGIADSPLPVLQAGISTQLLYSVPGVLSDAGHSVATYFSCTSTSTSSIVVGVELFGAGGGSAINNAATTAFTLPAGGTVVFGTIGAVGISTDVDLTAGALAKGSARILSTSKALICTAFVADPNNNPPGSGWELTVVAKTKQKAAN
jgi:hypothetical protein